MRTPAETEALIGHDLAEAELARAAAGQRLHHAWLITGPAGIGKATLAYRFARFLLSGLPAGPAPKPLHVPPTHGTFRRVAADTHADLLTVTLRYDDQKKRMGREILVDDIREITGFLRLTPAEGGFRVVIIDGAEAMNNAAANALLKALEEPPDRAILLLVSHNPGALLPTLRSRCVRLALAPLDEAAMREVLRAAAPDLGAAETNALLVIAGGAPGRALVLADAGALDLAGLAKAAIDTPPDFVGRSRLIDQILKLEDGFELFLDLLRHQIHAIIAATARGGPDPRGQALLARRRLDAWAELWQALGHIQFVTLRFHMDRRQALTEALTLLA